MAEGWYRAYPYDEQKQFPRKRSIASMASNVGFVLLIVAALLFPPVLILYWWAILGFYYFNESPKKRPLIMLFAGLVLLVLTVGKQHYFGDYFGSVFSSMKKDSAMSFGEALSQFMFVSAPWSILLCSFSSMAKSYDLEYGAERYLRKQKPTLGMHIRRYRNERKIKNGKETAKDQGIVRFGVEVRNRFPWRSSLYGRMVEAPASRLGHGVVVGGSGRGKTTFLTNIIRYLLMWNFAVIYLDFKASPAAKEAMRMVAKVTGRKFSSLDLSQRENTWVDLFDWGGSPSELTSIIIESMGLPTEGPAGFYTNQALEWAPLQFRVLEAVGLEDGQGVFDFLLETSRTGQLKSRVNKLRASKNPKHKALYEEVLEAAKLMKDDNLSSYRAELNKIVNSAGKRLRPNPENPEPISMRDTMRHGGLFHIGIASDIDDVVVKVIGSLLIKQAQILVKERQDTGDYSQEWLMTYIFVDEASQLEERLSMFAKLYDKSREAGVFLWAIMQGLGHWPENVISSIKSDSTTFVVMNQRDIETGRHLGSTLGTVFARKSTSEAETIRGSRFGSRRRSIDSTEDRFSITTAAHLSASDDLAKVEKYHAWVWFTDETIPMSRDRWWYKSRVRGDMNIEHAAYIKMVPYVNSGAVVEEDSLESSSGFVQGTPEIFRLGGGGNPSTKSNDIPHTKQDDVYLAEEHLALSVEYAEQEPPLSSEEEEAIAISGEGFPESADEKVRKPKFEAVVIANGQGPVGTGDHGAVDEWAEFIDFPGSLPSTAAPVLSSFEERQIVPDDELLDDDLFTAATPEGAAKPDGQEPVGEPNAEGSERPERRRGGARFL